MWFSQRNNVFGNTLLSITGCRYFDRMCLGEFNQLVNELLTYKSKMKNKTVSNQNRKVALSVMYSLILKFSTSSITALQ